MSTQTSSCAVTCTRPSSRNGPSDRGRPRGGLWGRRCFTMALARIEIGPLTREEARDGRSPVRAALSEALQAPADDPTVRLAEYPREQFSLPYPDRHSDRY